MRAAGLWRSGGHGAQVQVRGRLGGNPLGLGEAKEEEEHREEAEEDEEEEEAVYRGDARFREDVSSQCCARLATALPGVRCVRDRSDFSCGIPEPGYVHGSPLLGGPFRGHVGLLSHATSLPIPRLLALPNWLSGQLRTSVWFPAPSVGQRSDTPNTGQASLTSDAFVRTRARRCIGICWSPYVRAQEQCVPKSSKACAVGTAFLISVRDERG